MAEIVDFGLQQHKIKMDSRYFENVLSVVAGDTGRRIEVQLLDTNGMVQNTTGLNLRLNAEIAGKATFTDATLVDAATGKYKLDLSNGMFLAPGNWQFQWQITDSAGKKLHSFAFTGNIGKNISEGGSQATNFYLNLEDLKKMQEDLVNGTIDSSILETNITEKLTDLETQYAPKLTEVTAQLAHNENHHFNAQKFNIPSDGVTSCVTALRDALAILPEYSTLVLERNKSYLIDDAVIITNQGITLDFNGSTVIYNSNVDYGTINGSSRNIGALIVKGSLSNVTTTVTGIDSLLGVNRWDGLYPDFSRRLTVADGSLFQEGDLAFLSYYNNGSNVFSTDFSDNPASLNIPVKINRVWGDEIAVSLKEDFKWTNVAQIGTLTKINPIKDVSILNMRFKDDSVHTLPASESDITTAMKKSWVNGIYFEYAENLTIENYRAESIWFAGLRFHRCYNVHVADVVAQHAKYFTGGTGYGIQITESHNGKLERIDGNDLRHLVDLTASGSFTLEDCGAYSTGSSGFDLHGKGEFDIVYTRCSGQFAFSNGFPEFACMVGSVRMSDCNIKFVAQYGILWVLSLQIDRSQIEMSNDTSINGTNVHISNSTIRITNTRRIDFATTYELGIFSNTRKGFYEDMSILHIDSVDVYYETEFRLPNKFKIGKFKFTTINNLNCINRTIRKLETQELYPTLIIYAEHLNVSGITIENWLVELNGGTPTHPFYTSVTDTFLNPLSTKVVNVDKLSIITNKNYSGQSGKTNNLLNIRGFDSVGEFGIGTIITLNKLYIFKNTASSDRWIRVAENVGLVVIKALDTTLMGNVLSYSVQGGTGFVLPTLITKDTVVSNTLTLATVVPGT